MKKKVLMAVSVLAVVALAAFTGYKTLSSQTTADLMLEENVEALTAGESGKDCGGYREWSTSGFLKTKHEFYDCLCVLRSGYSPKGNCN